MKNILSLSLTTCLLLFLSFNSFAQPPRPSGGGVTRPDFNFSPYQGSQSRSGDKIRKLYANGQSPVDSSCVFRTQTQGGWGAPPNGNNTGAYLHNNFSAAFPNGLIVGCDSGFTITLTSAQAVTDYLPAGADWQPC